MAVLAGTIITVGGNHVIDRLQTAGLGNVNMPIDTVREVGNMFIVDKVPMEPDFNFEMSSLDVSCDLLAFLTGEIGAQASASEVGHSDAANSGYNWNNVSWVNIASPWLNYYTGSAGTVIAGHLLPAYFPTKLSYSFGTTADSQQMCTLAGGEFYYAGGGIAPLEEYATGDGATSAFVTSHDVVQHRVGSGTSTIYEFVWGVIVASQDEQGNYGNVLMIENEDYTITATNGNPATITFVTPPASGSTIRYCYFTSASQSYPQTVHTATVVKPGAVRGRNILPWLWNGTSRTYLYGVQSMTLDATADTTVTRELGSDRIVGRTINGFDAKGTIVIQSKDPNAFINFLSTATGVSVDEVVGYFYQNPQPLGIDIQNPKQPETIIKTIWVPDAQIQPPGTPAKVNTATNFSFSWESLSGTFWEYRGGIAGYGTPGEIQ